MLQSTRPGINPSTGLTGARPEALHKAALSFRTRGGLAARSFAINEMLRRYEAKLDSSYDFHSLVVPLGSGRPLMRPPVVTERLRRGGALPALALLAAVQAGRGRGDRETCMPRTGLVFIAGGTGNDKSTLQAGITRARLEQPDSHVAILEHSSPTARRVVPDRITLVRDGLPPCFPRTAIRFRGCLCRVWRTGLEQAGAVAVLCIAVGGVFAQWLAWRLRLPAIVVLFGAGLIVGPGLQLLHPSVQFGAALRPLVGLAVAIVVFEGGLALDLRELRAAGEGVLRLTAMALPLNFAFGAAAAHWAGGMGWGPASLFGAITVVTGPTVVLPLLRVTRLERRASAFLKWEAIVNDPIGAILAAGTLQVLVLAGHGQSLVATLLPQIAAGMVLAVGLGVGGGLLTRWAFDRDQVPEYLKTPMLLALAMGTYATANLLIDGAGLLAATVLGVTLANLRIPGLAELRRFKLALVVMLVSALFITLTADLDRHTLSQLSWPVLLLTAVMLFAVRPTCILLATLGSGLSWQERALSAWIAPRGIVAAAVAGVAGLRLQEAGYTGANLVVPAVFTLIAATMVLHGFSLGPLARRLGLALAETPGVAVVGASPWSTGLALVLHEAGVPTLLVDTFPGALDPARMHGVPTLQAELVSDRGEEELSGRAVDYLVATTPDDIYNGLVCTRIMPELGRRRVFQLAPPGGHVDLRNGLSRDVRGQIFGLPALDHATCHVRHEQGWRCRLVTLDAPEDLDPAWEVLILLRSGGGLHLASEEDPVALAAAAGDRVVVFEPPVASEFQT